MAALEACEVVARYLPMSKRQHVTETETQAKMRNLVRTDHDLETVTQSFDFRSDRASKRSTENI